MSEAEKVHNMYVHICIAVQSSTGENSWVCCLPKCVLDTSSSGLAGSDFTSVDSTERCTTKLDQLLCIRTNFSQLSSNHSSLQDRKEHVY